MLFCKFATKCAVSEFSNKTLAVSRSVDIHRILALQLIMRMPDFTGGPMCKHVGLSAVVACVVVAEERNFWEEFSQPVKFTDLT